jgi:acetolactate synthase-1/3 small subunit
VSVAGDAATATHHLVTLRVENKAGVLVRIAGLFARRGFNIVSLAVAPTDDDRFSRISIVVDADSAPLQQVVEQLDKLINVVEIIEISPADALEVELLLATVADRGDELDALIARQGAVVLERVAGQATVMLSAHPDELDRFAAELVSFGIEEIQRTGRIALRKLT